MHTHSGMAFNGLIQDIPEDSVTTYLWPEYSQRMTVSTVHDLLRLPVRHLEILQDLPERDEFMGYMHIADIVEFASEIDSVSHITDIYKCPIQYIHVSNLDTYEVKQLANKPVSTLIVDRYAPLHGVAKLKRKWPIRELHIHDSVLTNILQLDHVFNMEGIRYLDVKHTSSSVDDDIKRVLSKMTLGTLVSDWGLNYDVLHGIVNSGVINLDIDYIYVPLNKESIDLLQKTNITNLTLNVIGQTFECILYMPKLKYLTINDEMTEDALNIISKTRLEELAVDTVPRDIQNPLQYMPPTLKVLYGSKRLFRSYLAWDRTSSVKFIENDE